MELSLLNSPYLIEFNPRVVEALDIAIENGLFSSYNLDLKTIRDYKTKKKLLPIWILEAACNINGKRWQIPITYQNIWFCLHNCIITRTQPSGKVFRPKVQFATVYTYGYDLLNLLEKAKKIILKEGKGDVSAKNKFVELSGFKPLRRTFYNWHYRKAIPITAVIKACQILGLKLEETLDNHCIFSKTSRQGKILFKNDQNNPTFNYILNWINTDGHLEIGSTHITIDQKFESLDRLKTLEKVITNYFKLAKTSSIIYKSEAWGGYILSISSAPLRAVFTLLGNINIGYKCGSISKSKLDFKKLKESEKCYILSALCETEGSFSICKHHKKWLAPRFEFKAKDLVLVEQTKGLLTSMEYKTSNIGKSNGLFSIGIYNIQDFFRLYHNLAPYLNNSTKTKIKSIIRKLKNNNITSRIYLKNKKYVGIIRKLRVINKTNRKTAMLINKKLGSNYSLYSISEWANGYDTLPLGVIANIYKFLGIDSKRYIPTYYHKLI